MQSRREFVAAAASAAALGGAVPGYQVGAYYFPNYHVDPRNEQAHGKGWTEWELVKGARPRYPGHRQPKVPAWGYQDEADPRIFARKIDTAADHHLTHFIFDWYWYDDGPFLNRCLDEGYLQAANRERLKFALMWANHDWLDIFPAKLSTKPPLQYPGTVTAKTFDRITDHVVGNYFTRPEYWKLAGAPYFSFYELMTLVKGFGGAEEAKRQLDRFRAKTRAAGLPAPHLNAVTWGVRRQAVGGDPKELLGYLGIDSTTSYVWVHHLELKPFPRTRMEGALGQMEQSWRGMPSEFGLPFHPNVTVGWDSSPRCCQTDVYTSHGYPWTPVWEGNTPARFETALRAMKRFLDEDPKQPRICNLNAWNEWTEGSYLEPDQETGLQYLEAVQRVF